MGNFFSKIRRLKRLRKRDIPSVVYSKITRVLNARYERLSYSVSGPRWPQTHPDLPVKPVNLFHRDVRTTGFGELFVEGHKADSDRIIRGADRAADLVFDLLGSGPVDIKRFRERTDLVFYPLSEGGKQTPARVEGLVPWHFDFKSGVGWNPHTFFTDIRYGDVHGVDIKVPWELSRCQHFLTLGQAYRLTGDEKYARSYFEQIEDWIRQNPPKHGVNWSSSMDVALRACNWLVAWELFQSSRSITPFFKSQFRPALWEHGEHISRHLEKGGGIGTNHYLANLMGLAYIGVALGIKKWRTYAKNELVREIFKQTYEDGLDYEGSTAYHRLVLEIYFYTSLVFSRSANDAPEGTDVARLQNEMGPDFVDRLSLMFDGIQKLIDSDGRIPFIGDNDSGRAHVLLSRSDFDVRALLDLGALFFKEQNLKVEAWEPVSELAWIFGQSGRESFRAMPGIKPDAIKSKGPARSGYLTLRGPNDLLIFSAQPNGTKGIGNHAHNDKLSFTLTVEGDSFLIDPGSGVYTPDPEVRNLFRSTGLHNTMEVDGEEQNRFIAGNLFALREDSHARIDKWSENRQLTAINDGYQRLAEPVLHSRSIERQASPLRWIVIDQLTGKGEHQLKWSFLLGDSIKPTAIKGGFQLKGEKGILEILSPAEMQLEKSSYSPAYGVIRPTQRLRIQLSATLPARFQFEFRWTAA